MSDRMTVINLPGSGDQGWAEWGRREPDEMIRIYKARAARIADWAAKVLEADPKSFRVETFIGPYARKNLQILQEPQ